MPLNLEESYEETCRTSAYGRSVSGERIVMSFRGGRLGGFALPLSSVWLLTDIAEAKGRQELYSKQSPQLLQILRETALIQSVESSNRIEGVTVAPERLRPLVEGSTRPRDRSEEEIQGYRRALNLIHSQAADLSITPQLFQHLHKMMQDGGGDAGQWKRIDNEIVELRPGALPRVRFRPVSAAATSAAVKELCLSYRHALDQEHVPPLVAAAALILDLLCIHPFRDGFAAKHGSCSRKSLFHGRKPVFSRKALPGR